MLAVEGIAIAIAAPFVMSDMSSTDVGAPSDSAMRARSSSAVIHIIEHAPPPHMKMYGVVQTFANPIFDGRNAKRIGRDQGSCVHIALAKAFECVWTTILPGGAITAEGPMPDKGEIPPLAITGGTGRFASARGWLQEKVHDKAGTQFDEYFHVTS